MADELSAQKWKANRPESLEAGCATDKAMDMLDAAIQRGHQAYYDTVKKVAGAIASDSQRVKAAKDQDGMRKLQSLQKALKEDAKKRLSFSKDQVSGL